MNGTTFTLSPRTNRGIAMLLFLLLAVIITGSVTAIMFYFTNRKTEIRQIPTLNGGEKIPLSEPEYPATTTAADNTNRAVSSPTSSTSMFQIPNAQKPAKNTPAEICKKEGGRWMLTGLEGIYQCVHSYPDAGKPCSSSQECAGECIVTRQRPAPFCKENDNPFECYATIENFREQGKIMCVD